MVGCFFLSFLLFFALLIRDLTCTHKRTQRAIRLVLNRLRALFYRIVFNGYLILFIPFAAVLGCVNVSMWDCPCVCVFTRMFRCFFSLFRYKIVGALFFHLIHTKCDHMHINSDSIKSTDLCTFFDASFFSLSNSWLSFFYFAMNAFFFYLSPLCLRATSINISMCIVCVHFFSIQCTQPHAFAAGGHDFALNH